MSLATRIAQYLPYLRRFARALCGSQSSGDAYVGALLEALVRDSSIFPQTVPTRIGLYKTFLGIWNSVEINHKLVAGDPGPPAPKSLVDRRLETMASRPRQAFLLITLEEFAPSEAADVMGIDIDQFNWLAERAASEIAAQVATDVLVIEDEPLIALDIEDLVTSMGHRVSKVARTYDEALAAAKVCEPGLVLADIQLADGSSGIDAVNDLLKTIEVPVVFITAYPERLLTGERPEPTFLVTKPFQTEAVKAVIAQALFFDRKAKSGEFHDAHRLS